jgi:hypothetical protein
MPLFPILSVRIRIRFVLDSYPNAVFASRFLSECRSYVVSSTCTINTVGDQQWLVTILFISFLPPPMKRTRGDGGAEVPKKHRSNDDPNMIGEHDGQAVAVDQQVLGSITDICLSPQDGKVVDIVAILQRTVRLVAFLSDEHPVLSSIACGMVIGLGNLDGVIDPDAEVPCVSNSS